MKTEWQNETNEWKHHIENELSTKSKWVKQKMHIIYQCFLRLFVFAFETMTTVFGKSHIDSVCTFRCLIIFS